MPEEVQGIRPWPGREDTTSTGSNTMASKVCDKCGETFTGFGTICSGCRKLGGHGAIRSCEICGAFLQSYGAACQDCVAGDKDTHASLWLRLRFPVELKGKVDDARRSISQCVDAAQGKVYDVFAEHDDEEFLLRVGFENAAALLAFIKTSKVHLDSAVAVTGFDGFRLLLVAPESDCPQLHEAVGALDAEIFHLEESSRWYKRLGPGPDRHLTLAPFFKVPKGRLEEFKALLPAFYEGSRQSTRERLYYGWAMSEDTLFCRQGFKNAEGILAHLRDVDAVLEKAMKIVGSDGFELSVVGPVEELEKLRIVLGPYTPQLYELCE